MQLHEWKSLGGFDRWQGHEIFRVIHQAEADRPWLLLIHGFPTASYDYHQLWHSLGTQYNLLAFDMLGFGYSDKPTKWNYSVMHQADIAEQLLASNGIRQISLLAHDLGDTVAQELLARHQTGQMHCTLQSVVLLNGGLFPETHHALAIQKLLLGPAGPYLSFLMSYRGFRKNLKRICSDGLGESDIANAWALLRHKQGNRRMHQLIRYIPERVEHRSRWVGALQSTQVPWLLIDGLDDPISGKHLVDRFLELVPRGHVLRLAGLGHYPHLENARRVLQPTIDFLMHETAKASTQDKAQSSLYPACLGQ